jgi:hypothetical protein
MKCGNCGALEFAEVEACCADFERAEIARMNAEIARLLDESNELRHTVERVTEVIDSLDRIGFCSIECADSKAITKISEIVSPKGK